MGGSDQNLYSNGNHLRSPQFGMMNQTPHSGHHSHNLTSNHLPPPNMQYNNNNNNNNNNNYNSPPNNSTLHDHQSPNNSINNLQGQQSMNTPPRGVTSHRADFSPLPYTAAAVARQIAPPQFNLHDPNSMYSHQQTSHHHHKTYGSQDPSYAAYQYQKRGRSASADHALTPYLGTNKASQQPNMFPRHYSHDPMYPTHTQQQPQQHTHQHIHSTNDQLPSTAPSFGDGTRVSRTFNPPHPDFDNNDITNTNTIKTKTVKLTIQTERGDELNNNNNNNHNNNTSTPPPPNAEQVKNSPHNFFTNRDITFQDTSMLQPPRATRSISHGNLMGVSNSGGNNNNLYLPNLANISNAKMQKLEVSSSLPSSRNNRVPKLPMDQGYYVHNKTPTDC